MSSDFRGSTAIKMRELHRLELLEQAEQYRLAELADAGNPGRQRFRIDVKSAIESITTRFGGLSRSRGFEPPIDLEPSASKSA